jgi:hypothetical protein
LRFRATFARLLYLDHAEARGAVAYRDPAFFAHRSAEQGLGERRRVGISFSCCWSRTW